MDYNKEWFSVEINNNIIFLTMNAPQNNLMTADFLANYEAAAEEIIREFKDNDTIIGMIIRGGRHFSVGADVSALSERSTAELSQMDGEDIVIPKSHLRQKMLVTSWNKMPFPVVAAVGGFCIGSGSEIAVACHFRICEKNARIGQPESTFGILPALGGIARTIDICGVKNAVKIVYSGELLSAAEALEMNWADMITDKKKSVSEATALIQFIAAADTKFDSAKKAQYLAEFLNSRGNLDE